MEYGDHSVVILLVVHHVFVPTPEISVAVPGFEGPFVSAKAAGVSVENINPKIRAMEVAFLKVSENEIFIGNK